MVEFFFPSPSLFLSFFSFSPSSTSSESKRMIEMRRKVENARNARRDLRITSGELDPRVTGNDGERRGA